MDAYTPADVLMFDKWRFDRRRQALCRQNTSGEWQPVTIGSRAVAVLGVLLDRPGALVSKDAIMAAVWPRTVEPNNLTVQITALRRILDAGRTGGSCIQTVPGRGYRFFIEKIELAPHDAVSSPNQPRPGGKAQACLTLMQDHPGASKPPLLSMVVLPFDNLSGDPDQDCMAAAITEDLTTDLCRLDGACVIACPPQAPWQERPIDVRRTGAALGVRYVIKGSTRKLGDTVRVNIQLISTEANVYLWASRFDIGLNTGDDGLEEAIGRLKAELLRGCVPSHANAA